MLQENIYDKEQLQIVKEDWEIRDRIKEEKNKLSEEERKKLRLSYNRLRCVMPYSQGILT